MYIKIFKIQYRKYKLLNGQYELDNFPLSEVDCLTLFYKLQKGSFATFGSPNHQQLDKMLLIIGNQQWYDSTFCFHVKLFDGLSGFISFETNLRGEYSGSGVLAVSKQFGSFACWIFISVIDGLRKFDDGTEELPDAEVTKTIEDETCSILKRISGYCCSESHKNSALFFVILTQDF